MLNIILPKSVSTGGAVNNYKSVEVITQATERSIESRPIEATYMLDEAGRITTDFSKAKSILYQEVKDGQIVTRQEPVSNIDREIAKLRILVKEIEKGVRERELMWLNHANQLLKESKKTSYWICTADDDCYT